MLRVNRHFVWSVFLILVVIINLMNVNVVLADDSAPPPPATEEPTQPPVEPTETPVVEETPAPTETPVSAEEQVPAEEEAPVTELLAELPENTDIVVLDENGNPVSLASQSAMDAILEDDPMWCPAGSLPGSPACRNFTGASGITNLLTDMRNNTSFYDENGIIYFTSNPGTGAFTLTDAAASLGAGDFATLRPFNITLQGGWNGVNGAGATFTGQTNFGTNYIAVGTSANPWVGNVTILNMTVDGHTAAPNPSIAVYTTGGSATLNNILVDDADNTESIRVSTGSGNINMTNVDVTDGDDNYALNLTTTSGSVTLNDVLVDDHTDADAIRVVGGKGTITFNNVDVTDGSDGDGIDITTTGGTVNLNNVDVDSQDGGNGINVTTISGNINLDNADVSNHEDGRTANLNSQSGNINVFNNSDFEGDNTNQGFFATTITGTITITGTAANRIEFTDAEGPGAGTNYNGATLTAPVVSLTYVTANDSDGNGIQINATDSVTLNNVIADDNGTNPAGVGNALGSGVRVNGDGSTIVNVTGGGFDGNERYGIEVINGSFNFISMPTFGINGLGDYYPGGEDTTGPVITPTVFCTQWGTNGWCRGLLIVFWNVSDPDTFVSSQTGCGTVFINSNTPYTGQTITCSATSGDGTLPSSNSVTVYRDATQPNITVPGNMTVEATGPSGAVVNFTATATDSVDPSVLPVCVPPSGSTFPLGTTNVTCTATDDAGNSRTGNFNVTVVDTTPPALTLPANITEEATGPSGKVVTFSATATDLVDGARPVTCVPPSGSTFPIATTTVNCSASDTRGNTANSSFTVTVQDTTPPTLTLPSNITQEATGPAGNAVTYSASATDLVDGARPVTCVPPSGSVFPITTTTVNCSSSDTRGNTANGSFTVTVQDTTPPVISLMPNMVVTTGNEFGAQAYYSNPTTSDIVDGPGVATCSPPSGYLFPPGNTTVTCTATDSHGNTSSITFIVHINYKPLVPGFLGFSGIIAITGGELIDLNCFTVVNAFGILVTFHNLCDEQGVIEEVTENTLPSALPGGFTFVKGLDVQVLNNGQLLETLPNNTGVQMDFPLPARGQFAVLYWDNDHWVEIAQLMNDSDLDAVLATDAVNELYKMSSSNGSVHKALTTELTGTFVLVQK